MARATRTNEDEPKAAPPPEPEVEARGNGTAEDDEFTSDSAIPGPELGDVGGFAEFAADGDDDAFVDDAQTLYCSVSRPGNDSYIRTYPDRSWWRDAYVVEQTGADNRKAVYLISKALRKLEELEGKVKRKRMVPYITLTGAIGLWPIGIDAIDNPWVASAMRACEAARENWVLVVSRREIGQNKARPADGKHPDPVWPKLSFDEMIDLAFLPERRITLANYQTHPAMRKIRGETT